MKYLIKKLLKEAVGVPSNIVETGDIIYNQLLEEVKHLLNKDKSPYKEYEFTLKGDYTISDYKFSKVNLTLNLEHFEQLDDVLIFGMSYGFRAKMDTERYKTSVVATPGKVKLSINIGVPDDKTMEDVYNYISKEKTLITSSITHELKHAYDSYKKPDNPVTYRADYEAYMNLKFGIPPIDEFFHYLYFIHSIENLVRPTEIASELQNGDIDKRGFIEFLKNNRTYSTLKNIYNFSYDKFRNDIKDNIDIVRMRLKQNNISTPESDDEVVDLILKLVFTNLINTKASQLKNDLTTHALENLFGFSGKKDEVFTIYVKRINKFKNYNDFYKNEEKMFKFVSGNLIKKIHKLFSILKDTKQTNESKQSILDWDLHHKSKGIEPKIETNEKYVKPKNPQD